MAEETLHPLFLIAPGRVRTRQADSRRATLVRHGCCGGVRSQSLDHHSPGSICENGVWLVGDWDVSRPSRHSRNLHTCCSAAHVEPHPHNRRPQNPKLIRSAPRVSLFIRSQLHAAYASSCNSHTGGPLTLGLLLPRRVVFRPGMFLLLSGLWSALCTIPPNLEPVAYSSSTTSASVRYVAVSTL
jgi:hypothetical protein